MNQPRRERVKQEACFEFYSQYTTSLWASSYLFGLAFRSMFAYLLPIP
jgi:hypothetical protein